MGFKQDNPGCNCCGTLDCTALCADGLPEFLTLTIGPYTLTLGPDDGGFAVVGPCFRYGGFGIDEEAPECLTFVSLEIQNFIPLPENIPGHAYAKLTVFRNSPDPGDFCTDAEYYADLGEATADCAAVMEFTSSTIPVDNTVCECELPETAEVVAA